MKGYFEKMKKFVLAFGIPVLAVASLIGSGYATWYFNSDVESASGTIAVEPSGGKAVGAWFKQSVGNVRLVLDQTKGKTDTYENSDDRLGVHFNGAFTESLIADADGDHETTDKFVSGTSYIVTTTITIPSVVAKYVNFTFKDSKASEDGLTLTKQSTLTVEGDDKEKFDFFKIAYDTTNSDVTVAYAKEPTTLADYNAMVDDVKNMTIGISFAAVIVVNNK